MAASSGRTRTVTVGAITRCLMPSKNLGSAMTIYRAVAALEFAELLFLPVDASDTEPRVDARQLHHILGSKETFTNWVKRRAEN